MKRSSFKKYNPKRISVSRLDDELLISFNGEETTHLNKARFWSYARRIFYVCAVIICISLLFFLVPTGEKENETGIPDDETAKNEILFSEQTDYSTPDAEEPLQISAYRVQEGDTLSEIARKFGVSMDTICGSNSLTSYDLIHVGKLLHIPNQDGILHKVKKGQRLITIAQKYKVSIEKILAENTLSNPDFLTVGKAIFLPDAKPQNIVPGFLWPAFSRVITCGYGWRRHPILHRRQFHQGIDIRSKYQSIRATKYGKVTHTGWLGGYGKVVVLAHPGGWKSLYGHLSRIYVRRGQYVKQGQFIGKSGNTGRSTGPHLHFELIKRGRHVNPYKYLHR